MKIESKQKQELKQTLYRISLITFVTAAIWIGFEIYWSYQTTQTSEEMKEQIEPLNPNLDLALVNQLKSRQTVDFSDSFSFQQYLAGLKEEAASETTSPPPALPSPPTGGTPSTPSGQINPPTGGPATGSGSLNP